MAKVWPRDIALICSARPSAASNVTRSATRYGPLVVRTLIRASISQAMNHQLTPPRLHSRSIVWHRQAPPLSEPGLR